MPSPAAINQFEQTAVALFVAGSRGDIDAITQLVRQVGDHGGATELAYTLTDLAVVAGHVFSSAATDKTQLDQYLRDLPLLFAQLEEDR